MIIQYALLVLTGLVAGVFGGLLGIGGSGILIPAMVWILGAKNQSGVEQIHQYMAAAMIVNFLLALPSALAHGKNKAIWKSVWMFLTAGALIGIVSGVEVSYLFSNEAAKYLRWALGVFFIYVAGQNISRLVRPNTHKDICKAQAGEIRAWQKLSVGVSMGFTAGLLGLGGGTLAVPIQQVALKIPLRNAIATSAATIASVSWLGAILKNVQLGDNGTISRSLLLAACLTPTAVIGAWFGGHMTHKLPIQIVRVAFVGIMILSALKMFGWI